MRHSSIPNCSTGEAIRTDINPKLPLVVKNLSRNKPLYWRAFNSQSILQFSGAFDLDATVWLGRLDVDGQIIRSSLLANPHRFRFVVIGKNVEQAKLVIEIEYSIPVFFPLREMNIRVWCNSEAVFSQGTW